jgi:hypothetical protein
MSVCLGFAVCPWDLRIQGVAFELCFADPVAPLREALQMFDRRPPATPPGPTRWAGAVGAGLFRPSNPFPRASAAGGYPLSPHRLADPDQVALAVLEPRRAFARFRSCAGSRGRHMSVAKHHQPYPFIRFLGFFVAAERDPVTLSRDVAGGAHHGGQR